MGKKRKRIETTVISKKTAPERPKRTRSSVGKIRSKRKRTTPLLLSYRRISYRYLEPKDQRKAKPFHDHVFVFSIVDDHIWFRNYQISVPRNETDKVDWGGVDKMTLVEVGPRFCLNLIKIFGGSFGGPTLFENPNYISTNQIRALEEKKKSDKYAKKVKAKTRRKMHEQSNPLEPDEFTDLWKE